MSGSPLTAFQERYSASSSLSDLAVGYPRLTTLSEQWRRFRELIAGTDQAPQSRNKTLEQLKTTVRTLLDTAGDVDCEVTFSGSVALERTISALVPHGRQTVVPIPGFDPINSFIERSSGQAATYVELDPFQPRTRAIDILLGRINSSVGAVVLISPNNPSGLTLSPAELEVIADACAAVDAVLIVDHCFTLINPRGYTGASAFSLGCRCRWAALWDSSKTVELLGEKCGLVFGSPDELGKVRSLLEEIQFDLPLGSLTVINAILTQLVDSHELRSLNDLIRQNYTDLEAICGKMGLEINTPDAGGFALINIAGWIEPDSLILAEKLLREFGIAVMPSRLLYAGGLARDREFLRVSLGRPREMMRILGDALTVLAGC